MNYRLVARDLGRITLVLAGFMLVPGVWALYYREWAGLSAVVASAVVTAGVGAGLFTVGRRASQKLFEREALALVGLGWALTALLGALPFLFSGTLSVLDAFFESMSGFTTTGSTVLVDIEAASKTILFWRALTHWIGALGIVVLFIAVLPYIGAGGKQLFRSQPSGPENDELRPRVRQTAAVLFKLFAGLTVAQTVVLMLAGMSLYDALCHSFATLATGGYSTYQASVGAFDSLVIEIIIVIFMIIGGTSFALFYEITEGRWRMVLRNTEFRVYLLILGGAILLVTLNLWGVQGYSYLEGLEEDPTGGPLNETYSFGHALRAATFTTTSLMTTTGFATEDFDRFPHFSKMIFILIMVLGGCAGSTSGGLKVARVVMLFKLVYWRVEKTFRPKTIRVLRMNGEPVDGGVQEVVYAFFALYVGVFAAASLALSLTGLPFLTAISSVAATINGVGPGLEFAGASEDFHLFPTAAKLILTACMLLGRLEFFTLCAFLFPSFWRRT